MPAPKTVTSAPAAPVNNRYSICDANLDGQPVEQNMKIGAIDRTIDVDGDGKPDVVYKLKQDVWTCPEGHHDETITTFSPSADYMLKSDGVTKLKGGQTVLDLTGKHNVVVGFRIEKAITWVSGKAQLDRSKIEVGMVPKAQVDALKLKYQDGAAAKKGNPLEDQNELLQSAFYLYIDQVRPGPSEEMQKP